MQKKGKEQSRGWTVYAGGIFWGCLWALLICVFLIFICSAGISCGLLSEKNMQGCVFVVCVLGCFVGGLIGASRCGARILLIALAVGAAIFAIQFAIGMMFYNETNLLGSWSFILCADLVGGAVAGLVYGKLGGKRKMSSRR